MKTPRTLKVLRLMTSVIGSILHNEPLLLQGNLAQLDELGGIYIKFLQIVVLNLSPTSQDNFLELLSVYERSKPDDLDIYPYLQSLAIPHLDQITNINPKPIGTGSFGQVYKAQLASGHIVVIKVLRPSVMRYIRYDLRLLNILSWFYSIIDRQKMLNFRDLYGEFKKTCLQEVNYAREAEAANHFYKQYQGHPNLVIPKTYLEFCTPKVIVQECVEGISLTDLIRYKTQGYDAIQYVRENYNSELMTQLYTIGYELMTNAVTGNLLQADPHPGNIVILPNNKVALIDFGMTTQLHSNRLAYYEMGLQYQGFYTDNVDLEELLVAALKFLAPKLYAAMTSADSLLGTSWGDEVSLLSKVRSSAMSVTQDAHSRAVIDSMIEQNQIMKILFFAINKGNRFGLSLDLQAIMLLKATHGYLTLMGQFEPQAQTVARVLSDASAYARQNMSRVVDLQPFELSPNEAIEILSTWFDKMSRNDPWLMQKIAGDYIK